jgi:hypothetical protein
MEWIGRKGSMAAIMSSQTELRLSESVKIEMIRNEKEEDMNECQIVRDWSGWKEEKTFCLCICLVCFGEKGAWQKNLVMAKITAGYSKS